MNEFRNLSLAWRPFGRDGGTGLTLAKEIYAQALAKKEALCELYATVIEIDFTKLPSAETVNAWTSDQFTGALRHNQSNPLYDANVRQLLHVGFKIAAMMGETYIQVLHDNRAIVSRCVTENLLERHMKPLFL